MTDTPGAGARQAARTGEDEAAMMTPHQAASAIAPATLLVDAHVHIHEPAALELTLNQLGVESFLVLSDGTQPPDVGDALIDITGEFQRLYGARGEFLFLIRPDGYVGLFQRPIDERRLRAYLARLFAADAVGAARLHRG